MSSIKNYYKTIAWLIVLLYLLLTPTSGLPKSNIINIPHADKLIHAALFGLLTIIFLYDSFVKHTSLAKSISVILLFSITLGILTEFIQHNYIAGRNGNVYDFLADIIGTILAICVYIFFGRKLFKKIRS